MAYLDIISESYGDEYRSSEPYGEWWSNYHTTYRHLEISEGKYGEPVDFKPKMGDECYLVYVVYNTGDSFGTSSGVHSTIGIYRDIDEANEIAAMIENDYKNDPDKFTSLEIKGRKALYTGAWKGYFETYCGAYVEALTVKGKHND